MTHKNVVVIASNATVAKLHNPTRDIKLQVQAILSYKVAGAEESVAFKSGSWDGRSSFLDFRSGCFPAGFVQFVAAHLRRRGFDVQHAKKPLPAPLGPENPEVDAFPEDPRYDYQLETVRRLEKYGQIIMQGATGCHAAGSLVVMFDGTLKRVEDVVVGDMLMGPDSRPRNVLALHRGEDEMHEIVPNRGEKFVVNGEHVLSLQQTTLPETRPECVHNGRWLDISVNDYLGRDKTFKHIHKLHRSTGVTFESDAELPVEPYMLGLYLGDGHMRESSVSLTTADPEIVDYLEGFAAKVGMFVTVARKPGNAASSYSLVTYRKGGEGHRGYKKGCNALNGAFASLDLIGKGSATKFVPHMYKVASRQARLELLAGLIDTDGALHNGGFDFVSKSPPLAADVAFIARSVGLQAVTFQKTINTGRYAGNTYTRVSISGDCSIVPVKIARKKAAPRSQLKNHNLTGFKVNHIGRGQYFGFTVDEDHLYLMGDFTITHNCGKSRIARLAYARINRPTLFLTTRGILMHQMKDAFEQDLGVPVSVLGDGQFGYTDAAGVEHRALKKMTVGMVQTLMSRLKEPDPRDTPADQKRQAAIRAQTINILSKFEFVILEEAHEASGNSYYEILSHCKNAYYRLALTATPFMKDDEEANMRLMAVSGPVGIKITEKMLIDRGILAKPYFKTINLKEKPPKLHRSTAWQAAYRIGIIENKERNLAILREAITAARMGMSVMLLIQQKKHGTLLAEAFTKAGVNAEFIMGDNDQDERKKALQKLASGEISVLIGSTILDVGVDVPAVGMVILAGGGKAEVALRQRIGRGLRAKKHGPNVALIADFDDPYNHYLKAHAQQRLNIIQSTPGFAENILPPGQDFDYGGLGLSRKAA